MKKVDKIGVQMDRIPEAVIFFLNDNFMPWFIYRSVATPPEKLDNPSPTVVNCVLHNSPLFI